MIRLKTMGINIKHLGEFCIDRPNGSGDYLLIIFKTDALLYLDGEERMAPADSAIIFGKGTKQYYRSICGNYVNHFLHFDIDDDYDLAGITTNSLLIPASMAETEDILSVLSREHFSASPNKERFIDILMRFILLKVCETKAGLYSMPTSANSESLNMLRAEMYSNAGKFKSVADMAERINVSPSYLHQLYKDQFGISCYDDLLSAKIKMAQYYLGNSTLSVKEISSICGYDNSVCFMRRFKDRVGLTPSEYRKMVALRT